MLKDYQKLVSRPSFVSQKIFSENFEAVHKIKEVLTLNKQAYGGIYILDLCKSSYIKVNYSYIKDGHCKNAKLLFKNADSLV